MNSTAPKSITEDEVHEMWNEALNGHSLTETRPHHVASFVRAIVERCTVATPAQPIAEAADPTPEQEIERLKNQNAQLRLDVSNAFNTGLSMRTAAAVSAPTDERAAFEAAMIKRHYPEIMFKGFYAEGEWAYYDRKANEMHDAWQAARAAAPVGSVLAVGQILAAERRSSMSDDEALRFGRAIESMTLRAAAAPVSGPSEFGQKVTRLVGEIRKAKSLAWRDGLFEQLLELIEPSPEGISAAPVSGQGATIGDDPKFIALFDWLLEAFKAGKKADLPRFNAGVQEFVAYIDSRPRSEDSRADALSRALQVIYPAIERDDLRAIIEAALISNGYDEALASTPPKADK